MKVTPQTLEWLMGYYRAVDADDVDTMMQYFAADARLRFGNGEFIVGRDAIRAQLSGVAKSVQSLTHDFHNIWEEEGGVLVIEADARFVLLDGKEIIVNGCAIFRHLDEQWTQQLHFADVAAVFRA